jgi:methylated-DNA-[protein]-cysteine S-methyltransferase
VSERATTRWWRQTIPWGDIVVEVGAQGVTRISLPDSPIDERVDSPRRDPRVARQLDAYFAGRRRELDVAVALPEALSDFQRRVLLSLRAEVGYGETVTYGELAEIAGRPGAARAVGSTMARNPVPFVIPCHRVVAANGIGGYGNGFGDGVALKRALLDLEAGIRIP